MIASPALHLRNSSRALRVAAVIAGTGILTLSSYIEVPMYPVPMTLQTLAVTMIGVLYGWRLGAATIVAWLIEAAIGLPVLAGNHLGGPGVFIGPTAGYLLAFPLAAALVGWLTQHGWIRLLPTFAAMLLGNALCLVLGAAWLATLVGPGKAVLMGVVPFALGGIVKSALGAAILKAAFR